MDGAMDSSSDADMDGAIEAAIDAAAVVAGAVVAAGLVELPALEHAPTKVTAMMRPAKAPVRVRLFTCSLLLLVDPTGWSVPLGLVGPPGANRADDVSVAAQVTAMTTECQPVAPSG